MITASIVSTETYLVWMHEDTAEYQVMRLLLTQFTDIDVILMMV